MIVALVCAVIAASPAAAEKSSEKARAKEFASQANAAYTMGRFDEALEKYTQAYGVYPAPEFLFNIGQCHKNLNHYDRALFFFQGFLRQKPNTPNRKLVEELIQQTEKEAEERRKAEARRQGEIAASMQANRAFQPQSNLADTPVYKKGWFWGVIGGSVAAVAVVTTLAIVLSQPTAQPSQADYTLDFRAR